MKKRATKADIIPIKIRPGIEFINSKLKDKFNADFNIQLNIEPELIGGLKIQVGSQMIDSSIKNQLQLLKEKMKEVA